VKFKLLERISNQEAIEYIKENCQPILEYYKKSSGRLWRGMGFGAEIPVIIKDVRKDRKPKDTPIPVNNYIDNYFYQKFGWRAKSESLFTTSNPKQATMYGELYQIFPVGQFGCLWSYDVHDLYQDFTKFPQLGLINYINIEDNKDMKLEWWRPEQDVDIDWSTEVGKNLMIFLEDKLGTYKEGNLESALSSGNEIMIDCDKYVTISYANHLDEFAEALGIPYRGL